MVVGLQVVAAVDGHLADGHKPNAFHKQQLDDETTIHEMLTLNHVMSIVSTFCHYHSLNIYLQTMNVCTYHKP